MANPPINRRPGIDADIVQTNWTRGYDGPQLADDPCDIWLSNGRNAIDGRVANLLVWNRTDNRDQPMFIMVPAADIVTGDKFNFHAGNMPDPNGVITSPAGSLYLSNNPPTLWMNLTGGNTWKVISDDLGNESLEETLAIGNVTGNYSIIMSSQPNAMIIGESSAVTDGTDVRILGGPTTAAAGTGGRVILTGGTSTNGATGQLTLTTPASGGSGSSGAILCQTGSNVLGGNAGAITLQTGSGLQGGEITLTAGNGALAGGNRGGRIQLIAGSSPADGDGGRINIASGSPGTPITFTNTFTAGKAGTINMFAGNSAGTQTGGLIFIYGGNGGSGGGKGGNVTIRPGNGGGGADDGIVDVQGILEAENYPRGDGDPNVLAVSAEEGSIFQRSTAGFGQAWLNTDGTSSGWKQLLTAGGGIVSALTQIQWGSLQASTDKTNDELAADGTFYAIAGSDLFYQISNTKAIIQGPEGSPCLNMTTLAAAESGVYIGGLGFTAISRDSKARIVFKVSLNQVDADTRFFVGITQNTVLTQVAGDAPGGSWYGVWKKTTDTNFRFQSQHIGSDNQLSSVAIVANSAYYFVFDLFPDADGGVTVKILSEDYTELDSHTFSPANSLLPDNSQLRFLAGLGSNGAAKGFDLYSISVVTRIDLAEAAFAGGLAGLASPLAQVLLVGNTTGGTDMIFTHGDVLEGEEDGNAGAGGDLTIRSGGTTGLALATGNLVVASAGNSLAGYTGTTGDLFLSSGLIGDVTNVASGSTGDTRVTTGLSTGAAGSTGTLGLFTGVFTAGGGGALATTGDILIAPGSFASNPANPGLLDIRGGTTSLIGVTGGEIRVTTGSNTVNGSSGGLLLSTGASAVDGSTGAIQILAGLPGTNSGSGGTIVISAGDSNSAGALSGNLVLSSGSTIAASGGDGGDVFVNAGNSEVTQGGMIEFTTGNTTIGGQRGGDVVFNLGTGPGGDGTVIINGKLTVTGPIDPTGLLFSGVAGIPPLIPVVTEGILWTDTTDSDKLKYTNAGGTVVLDGTGGGGETLAATLLFGNNTGGTAIEIDSSLVYGILGQSSAITDGGNIGIKTGSSGVGAGGQGGNFYVVIGDTDPTGNSPGGSVSFTTGAGAGTGLGGDFAFFSGNGGATNARGGNAKFELGDGQGTGTGGGFEFICGDGGAGNSDGGSISLVVGSGNGTGVNGQVNVTGDLTVSGAIGAPALGQITIGNPAMGDMLNLDSPAIKIGTFVVPPGPGILPGPYLLLYATVTQGAGGLPWSPVFSAVPRSIQLTLETAAPTIISIGPGSITPASVILIVGAPGLVPADVIHIVAYL